MRLDAFERLEARKRVLGPKHPETLRTQHSLATVLLEKGDYGAAEAEFRTVLEARKRVLGPKHPETRCSCFFPCECLFFLRTQQSLAVVLLAKGDYGGLELGGCESAVDRCLGLGGRENAVESELEGRESGSGREINASRIKRTRK